MRIPTTCEATGYTVNVYDLIPIQGELKTLSTENYQRLKNSMIENGFMCPFLVWHDQRKNEVNLMDGHQRHFTVKAMMNEGYTFDELLPAIKIKATSLHDAKKKLLLISSQYGKIERDGLYEYICKGEIDVNFLDGVSFDAFTIESFKDEFIDDLVDKVNKGDENSEWADADLGEFEEGDDYIKLTFIFDTKEERSKYVESNNIKVKTKRSDKVWLVYP